MNDSLAQPPHVTHALIGERGTTQLVVSGPYTTNTEYGKIKPWVVSLCGKDDEGADVEEVVYQAEFSDTAESWAEGFMAAFRRIDKRMDARMEQDSRAPF